MSERRELLAEIRAWHRLHRDVTSQHWRDVDDLLEIIDELNSEASDALHHKAASHHLCDQVESLQRRLDRAVSLAQEAASV